MLTFVSPILFILFAIYALRLSYILLLQLLPSQPRYVEGKHLHQKLLQLIGLTMLFTIGVFALTTGVTDMTNKVIQALQ